EIDALPQVADALHRYVDEFHARVVAMAPLELSDEGSIGSDGSPRTVGVLVAEQFTGTDRRVAPPLLAELAHVAAPMVASSLAWEELPLGGVLRRLTWIRKPRSVVRALVLLGVMVAAVIALATIQ